MQLRATFSCKVLKNFLFQSLLEINRDKNFPFEAQHFSRLPLSTPEVSRGICTEYRI